MPPKILTDLAPELIIHILKSSDNFADLTSLSSASRKLFIIWKTNDDAICEVILARAVPCYEQVQELLAVQEEAEGDEHSIFGYQTPVDRVKWILEEADTATKALVLFEKKCRWLWAAHGSPVEQAVLTSAERTDFVRAFHRAKTLATLGKERLPIQMLSSWNMLGFNQVNDVMDWLGRYYTVDKPQDLGIWFHWRKPNQSIAGIISGDRWNRLQLSVATLASDLHELESKPDQNPGRLAPYFPSIVRSHYHDQYRSQKGACLADLLALTRVRGRYHNVAYVLSEA